MAWTTPKTWATSDPTTAALFNTHLKDNLSHLKTPFDDSGKLAALASAYLADLSGANLTGLSKPGSGNTYTAGRNDFNGGSAVRVVVPVGTDLFDGTAGNKTAGSLWVEGNYLHWVSSTKVEWRFLGRVVSTPAGAIVGSIWTEGTGTGSNLSYIDSSGVERAIDSSFAPHTDGAAVAGSVWVDTDYVHWSPGSGIEYQAHVDTHTDGTTHTDTPHSDTPHSDTHTDVPHVDYTVSHVDHTDVGHADVPYQHGDTPYSNSYSDVTHIDVPLVSHSDHGDVPHDDRPENMGT